MQYTTIANTNLRVSRLTFGTGSLHHRYRQSQRLKLLDTALATGITHFDTSPYYGHGLAESDLGLFMRGRRDALTVATKVGLYPRGEAHGALGVWLRKAAGKIYGSIEKPRIDWSIGEAERSLNASLTRLRTDYIDILFMHEPNPALIDSDEFLTWLEKQRSNGKIRYWGLAGNADLFIEWIRGTHPLAAIVQTNDSLDGKEADLVLHKGRPLQFTYGYLSSSLRHRVASPAYTLLVEALQRNRHGSVLFSTRCLDRIEKLAGIIG